MSAYGKPQQPNLHGFDTGQSSFSYVNPSYGSQASVPSATVAPVFQTPNSLTQMGYSASQARNTYDDQSGPYLNVGSTPVPEIISFSPRKASQGAMIYVGITALYELQTSNTPIFFLMFGNEKCLASLRKTGHQGAACSYTVTTEAPQFASLHWNSAQVPVYLLMEAGDGDVMAKVDCGHFTYIDGAVQGGDMHQEVSRKRKMSAESVDLIKSPLKRVSSQQLRSKDEYSPYTYTSQDGNTLQSPYLQSSSSYGSILSQYHRPTAAYQSHAPPRHMGYNYASASPPTIKSESAQVSTWSPGYSSVGSNLVRSPAVPSNAGLSRTALTGLSSPGAVGGNPPLIRTSTLQQTPSPAAASHGGHPSQNFNAYSLYPHKAKLEINGNLESMAQNWSVEEWDSKRRLVHFRRSQSGSTITTNFQPVSADERQPNSVCISCIYWEEKGECFVTSVDTIYLLEQLVAARFTVEEKNRIRRNLEGFRPLTVSKGKADSEEFFKVIMAFPTPKPRNIEKDVKVFYWKDLASALKKIIGKYSASPSSTLPPAPLLTPVSSTGYATEVSSAGLSYAGEHHGAVSPRSISGSTTSSAYNTNVPARVLSPLNRKSMPNLQSGPPDLRVSVPHPHESSGHWQGTQRHMPTSQQYQQLGHQSARGSSWDMSSYLENSPATTGGSSTPHPLSYGNPQTVADVAVARGENRIGGISSQQQSQQIPRS